MKPRFFSKSMMLIVASLVVSACSPGAATQEPEATLPAVVDSAGIVAEGRLMPAPSVELGFAQPGAVAEVSVTQGGQVAAGQVIARLVGDESARAGLEAARVQYQITLDAARSQNQKTRLANWYSDDPDRFTQPQWYFTRDEQIRAARAGVDAAKSALDRAQSNLDKAQRDVRFAEFLEAEDRLSNARMAYLTAKDVDERTQNATGGKESLSRYNQIHNPNLKGDPNLPDASQVRLDEVKIELGEAQNAYNKLLKGGVADDLLDARAELSVAQEIYDTALDRLRGLQVGELSPAVAAAQAAMNQAEAAIAPYELRAPFAGTVLSIDVVPGEVASAGVPVAFLGDLSRWQVETRDLVEVDAAKVALGATAVIKLDAFPGEAFAGKVIAIDPVGREYLGDMTYKVTVALDEPDPRFLWNMTATAMIDSR